jgi:hypothetical protein
MDRIVKSTWICKNGMSTSDFIGPSEDIFIKGKAYSIEYQEWKTVDGYRLNGGRYKYWAFDEKGRKKEMHKAKMRIVFGTEDEQRSLKIDYLLEP